MIERIYPRERTRELVSVCVPVYNGQRYIADTIDSILSQTWDFFELIVVDDCSTDASAAILTELAVSDSRIKIFRNESRLGLVRNWNRCIECATGRWIKFVFQDDLLDPECVQALVARATAGEERRRLIFCRRVFIFEAGVSAKIHDSYRKRKFIWDIAPDLCELDSGVFLKHALDKPWRNLFGEPSSFLIEKSVFDDYGIFDPAFGHICDLEFWLRVGVWEGASFVSEPLVYFRVHPDSMTTRNLEVFEFRTRYLDRVVLFWKFQNHAIYAPLRRRNSLFCCRDFWRVRLAIAARRARLAASQGGDSKIEREWSELGSRIPAINRDAEVGFLRLAAGYLLSRACALLRLCGAK